MSDITRDYSFGGWLRTFRLKRRIGLREMARRLDSDPANYCNIERSRTDPPAKITTIRKLVAPLALDESEIEMLISTAFSFHLAKFKQKWNEE